MSDDIIDIFITNLIMLREAKGCSRRALSELIGCESSYISKVEKRKLLPSLDKIIAIAEYFEVDFVKLFQK